MDCPACAQDAGEAANYCPRCGAVVQPRAAAPADGGCVVVLSFDVDGASGMINRTPAVEQRPSTLSLGEYGPRVGAPHVLALLARAQIPASFYVPGWVAERHPALVERIAAAGHELGHHGYLHEPPASLSRVQEAEVLDRGSAILEGISGERPRGYRSPSWELSPHSLELLAERGFLYDSSLMGSDAPYRLDEGGGLIEIPVHWSLDDYPYFTFVPGDVRRLMATPQMVYETWLAAFEEVHARGGAFTLTMHPYIIGRPGRLRMLGSLIERMRAFPNVRFLRAIDLAAEFAAEHPPEAGRG